MRKARLWLAGSPRYMKDASSTPGASYSIHSYARSHNQLWYVTRISWSIERRGGIHTFTRTLRPYHHTCLPGSMTASKYGMQASGNLQGWTKLSWRCSWHSQLQKKQLSSASLMLQHITATEAKLLLCFPRMLMVNTSTNTSWIHESPDTR